MSEALNQLYLIKIDSSGRKSEVPAAEANFLVGDSGTINFGFNSSIFPVSQLGSESTYSTIGGGSYNSNSGAWGVIDGGLYNSNRAYLGGKIGGGIFNQVVGSYGVIAGGYWNCIGFLMPDFKAAFDIAGNEIISNSFIGGGVRNRIEGNSNDALPSLTTSLNSIVGGCCNLTRGARSSFIAGGECNTISGRGAATAILSGNFATILGGCCNFIYGSYSSILNGNKNLINASNASILAGKCTSIFSNHSGATVLSDGQDRLHVSSGPHTLTLDFASGIYISGKLYLNGRQLLVSTDGTVFSPQTTS